MNIRSNWWPAVWIWLSVAVTLIVLLCRRIPLGIPDEWTWHRHSFPENLLELTDRFLLPVIFGGGLVFFCRRVDRRIGRSTQLARAVFLMILCASSFFWIRLAMNAASTPHRELRPLWVLYDKYASGYFYEAAFHIESPRQLLSAYEERVSGGDVLHEGTHPPGLFLASRWAIETAKRFPDPGDLATFLQPRDTLRVFRMAETETGMERPLTGTELSGLCLLSVTSLLITSLAPLAVYGIMTFLTGPRSAWRSAALTLTIPSVAVFAPRSDVVYATSASVLLLLIVHTVISTSRWKTAVLSVLTACMTLVCLLFSLAHLPVLVAGGIFGVLTFWQSGNGMRRRLVARLLLSVSCFAAAVIAFSLLTECALWRVWRWNLHNHSGFYLQFPRTRWKWMLECPVELAFAAGLPLTLLAIRNVAGILPLFFQSLRENRGAGDSLTPQTQRAMLVFSLSVTWAMLWLSGKNMGEAARLWCFLCPWLAIVSGQSSSESEASTGATESDTWNTVLVAQLIVSVATAGTVSGYDF